MTEAETIRDALSALSDEAPEVSDRKRKYCRQMGDGNWYTYHQCVWYYGNREPPPADHPHLQGTDHACGYLERQREDLTFRLNYPFGKANEKRETRRKAGGRQREVTA